MTTAMDEQRVEVVDNGHPRWAQVLDLVRRTGGLQALHLDADGWLSARHVLLVAFAAGDPAAYLSMRVQPAGDGHGHLAYTHGRPETECRIDCRGELPGLRDRFASHLLSAAIVRSGELRCRGLVDEDGMPVRPALPPGSLEGLHDSSV